MSIATGRDPDANNLLVSVPTSVSIAIPSICCMELLSALEDEIKKRRNRFLGEMEKQISQLKRDKTSPSAQSLVFHLEQSLNENEALINDINTRLFAALDLLATKIEMISLTAGILQSSLNSIFIEEDPTDNLILHCILNHAHLHPNEVKVFLSNNTKEFGLPKVRDALREVGITKYFSCTEDFLGWLQSQS
ncbi:PIN domain-containing protein [Microcoleus sp. w1-18aA5]|uniref:PIN domain-containing protein n=1 Tax=unclassified Microcoleus TaxID=2642155 RepID=UPI002FD6A6B3